MMTLKPFDLVAWLEKNAPEKPKAARPRQPVRTGAPPPDVLGRYLMRALAYEVANVADAPDGERNDQLNKSAFALGQLVPCGLSRGDIERQLTAAAEVTGLGTDEISKTIASGIEAGILEPRDLSHVGQAIQEKGTAPSAPGPKTSSNGDGHHQGHGQATANTAEPFDVEISTKEYQAVEQAIAALTQDPNLYQKDFELVSVRRDKAPARGIDLPAGTPQIARLATATIRERVTKHANCFKHAKNEDGEWIKVPVHPPDWLTKAIASRGEYDHIRHLTAIVEAPTLRPNGTVIDEAGHDPQTGLLFKPNDDFAPIPARPTRAQAKEAAEDLLFLVADFPFEVIDYGDGTDDRGATHKAAWLAALLTPIARFAIAGPVPFFVFDANTTGSGKTKLADIIGFILSGRILPRGTYPELNEELAKVILSIALARYQIVLFDNLATGASLGGPAMDAAATGTSVQGRILGKSEMSGDVPFYATLLFTGNNLGVKGDALRRMIYCRLNSTEERPEERTGFRIEGDLLEYVLRNRGRLVAAALTILRAHAVARRPKPDPALTPMDYAAWCTVVRNAIHWAIGVDPCATRKGLIAADPESLARAALVEGWDELPGSATGLSVADALRILHNRDHLDKFTKLRDVLMEWSRSPGELPNSQVIGKRLKAIKGRVISGKTILSVAYQGTQSWRVISTTSGGSGGSGGSVSNPAQEKSERTHITTPLCSRAEDSHDSHDSHRNFTDPEVADIDFDGGLS